MYDILMGVYLGMVILVTNGCRDEILSRMTMTSSGGGCQDLRFVRRAGRLHHAKCVQNMKRNEPWVSL